MLCDESAKQYSLGVNQNERASLLPDTTTFVELLSIQDGTRNLFFDEVVHPDLDISDLSYQLPTSVCEGDFSSRVGSPGSCSRRLRLRSPSVRTDNTRIGTVKRFCSPLSQVTRTSLPSTPLPAPSTFPGTIGDGPNKGPDVTEVKSTAYFSSTPPSEPLRLVMWPAQEPHKTFATRDRVRNHRRVRSLLRNLIAQLPLPQGPVGNAGDEEREGRFAPAGGALPFRRLPISKISRSSATTSVTTAASDRQNTADLCRNTAVQTQATEEDGSLSKRDYGNESKLMGGTAGKGTGERRSSVGCGGSSRTCVGEWVGGVRALRDSHVRLVVRQLRHIELLNRTIDQATAAASANTARDAPDSLGSRNTSATHAITSSSSIA